MYDCGDVLYNTNGIVVMVLGYFFEEVDVVLKRKLNTYHTIEDFDNSNEIQYICVSLGDIKSIFIKVNILDFIDFLTENLKNKLLPDNVKWSAVSHNNLLDYDYKFAKHINGMKEYFLKNKLSGIVVPDFYTKNELERKLGLK